MTPEMRKQRIGLLTASKAAVIMGGLKTQGLADYVKTLAFERVYGDHGEEGFETPAMRRGKELEQRALNWYAFERDCVLQPGGVCHVHPVYPFVGASPDAELPDRVIEVKCLQHKAWMDAFDAQEIPSEYRWQARWQQWVRNKHMVDFPIWHPVAGGFVIQRHVTPSEIEQMTERAFLIEQDVKAAVERLRNRRGAA